jgi:FixJ family two-component response regulator
MRGANPNVSIIDDDPEFRDSVGRLLRSVGLDTQQFSSVSEFLKAHPADGPTCLVLDIRMPGEAVSIFSATLPRRTGECRSSSLQRMRTSR